MNTEQAKQRIKDRISEIGKPIEFIDFVGGWQGSTCSLIKLKNIEYNEEAVITYGTFIRYGWSCSSEHGDNISLGKRFSEEEAIAKIQEKINIIEKEQNRHFEFLGIVGDKWIGATKTILKLRNTDYNEYKEVLYRKFFYNEFGWKCNSEKFCKASWEGENRCFELAHKIDNTVNRWEKLTIEERTVEVDVYSKENNYIIEYDGKQHYKYDEFFHKGDYKNYLKQVKRDNSLVQYCKDNSIRLLRIPWKDNNRLEEIIRAFILEGEDIATHLEPILSEIDRKSVV